MTVEEGKVIGLTGAQVGILNNISELLNCEAGEKLIAGIKHNNYIGVTPYDSLMEEGATMTVSKEIPATTLSFIEGKRAAINNLLQLLK